MNSSKNFNIVVTTSFKKHVKNIAKKYPSLKSDVKKLVVALKSNPTKGQPLGKDCYKVRLAITSKRRGKRGGSRIITCVKVVEEDVYLLTIYDKSVKEGISDNELDKLLKLAGF